MAPGALPCLSSTMPPFPFFAFWGRRQSPLSPLPFSFLSGSSNLPSSSFCCKDATAAGSLFWLIDGPPIRPPLSFCQKTSKNKMYNLKNFKFYFPFFLWPLPISKSWGLASFVDIGERRGGALNPNESFPLLLHETSKLRAEFFPHHIRRGRRGIFF